MKTQPGPGRIRVVGCVTLDSWTKRAECQWWANLTIGGQREHPKFLPLMETAMAIGRFFAQGVHSEAARKLGPALAGEGSQHLWGKIAMTPFGNGSAVTADQLDPGDGQGRGQ